MPQNHTRVSSRRRRDARGGEEPGFVKVIKHKLAEGLSGRATAKISGQIGRAIDLATDLDDGALGPQRAKTARAELGDELLGLHRHFADGFKHGAELRRAAQAHGETLAEGSNAISLKYMLGLDRCERAWRAFGEAAWNRVLEYALELKEAWAGGAAGLRRHADTRAVLIAALKRAADSNTAPVAGSRRKRDKRKKPQPRERLTKRQKQVIDLSDEGLSERKIANKLGLESASTVHKALVAGRAKLDRAKAGGRSVATHKLPTDRRGQVNVGRDDPELNAV